MKHQQAGMRDHPGLFALTPTWRAMRFGRSTARVEYGVGCDLTGVDLPVTIRAYKLEQRDEMRYQTHDSDFCVVGGGLAGLCAAVAAARAGASVTLMQDRPVLGGNASSEIRMWVCGAHGANNRETGIIGEILLENRYRNPYGNWSVWDSILYEQAMFQPNLTVLLNCSCTSAEVGDGRIRSIRGWQGTAETWHTVEAKLFADCSGDSILAPLSGAEFRMGREAAGEFGEDIQPATADSKTMGMSCLIQARQATGPRTFIPPAWAYRYESDDQLPYRAHELGEGNFWWMELGGEMDSIHDTEAVRDELLKVAFGVWDHIKNRGHHGAENWELDWVGFLPGKRESRRYVGDHILTQNDVRAGGRFEDIVGFGGWSMDDHHPGGMNYPGDPTTFHPAPSPFGIPYRCLYSRNVENLFCAGRNISATHAAMSSSRVMATCAVLGQAVGAAAAIAVDAGLTPRGVFEHKLRELQQRLMDDDCYLPYLRRAVPELTRQASLNASEGDPEPLRNGIDRTIGSDDNGWSCSPGGWVQMHWPMPRQLTEARIVLDSDMSSDSGDNINRMHVWHWQDTEPFAAPHTLVRTLRLEADAGGGNWNTIAQVKDNHQRLVRIPIHAHAVGLRLVCEETWGASVAHVYAFDVR